MKYERIINRNSFGLHDPAIIPLVELRHESSKTTEIYTPITTRGFDQIKSQLEKLNIL